jgi:RNA polymerase sigma factor for flagellar operon FliA
MADDDDDAAPVPLTPEQRQLANDNLDLVVEQARLLRSKFNRFSHEELVSLGYSGLVRAAKGYEPERGTPFKHFARHHIRGHIIDQIRLLSRYSERQQDQRKAIRRAEDLLAEKRALNKELTKSTIDLIDFLGDNPLPEYVDFAAADKVAAAAPSPETAVHRARIRERVQAAMKELDTDVRALMSQIYTHNRSRDEAAAQLGWKKSWVSKLHAKALRVLQDLFPRDS